MVACEGRRWAEAEQRDAAAGRDEVAAEQKGDAALNPLGHAAVAEARARAAVSWAASAEA